MKLSRRTATATAALAALAALGGTVATAAPASAATPTAYNGACGKGYDVLQATPIRSSQSTILATTFVTYNSIAGKVCAVTVRTSPGARVFMEVTLDTWPYSSGEARDSGSYTSYAGPVYKYAPDPGQCLTWSGSIDIYYNSEHGLCS
ncbi:hypothetical protein ACW4TU_26320 [Streptomyces sp. QTS52]